MAEEQAGDIPDIPRGDAPESGQRRRRAFTPAEPSSPSVPDATPPEAANMAQGIPTGMRRRRLAEDGANPSAPASPSAPADPAKAGAVSATKAIPDPVPPATDAPVGTRQKVKEQPSGDAAASVSPARRIVRVILLLVLMAMMAGMFYLLIEDVDQRKNTIARESIPEFRPFVEDPAGDELGVSLAAQIAAGRSDMVLAKRDEYLDRKPRHLQVLRGVYLAEAADLAHESFKTLATMPVTDTDDGSFLAVEVRLARLLPRMVVLNRLTNLRNDWGNTLLDVPGVREIFDATREETFLANRWMTDWRRYRAVFEEAFSGLTAAAPDYEAIINRLRPLEQILPNNGVDRICRNLQNLSDARNSVAANDMRSANDALVKMTLRDYALPAEGIEDRFEAVVEKHRNEIIAQFASWRRLWDESEAATVFYNMGEMERAVQTLTAVLERATPDSMASRALYDDLTIRNRRWSSILAAYEEAIRQDDSGSIPERMRAWQAFALLLDADNEPWQTDQALAGAQRIKNEFNSSLEKFLVEYAGDWDAYEEITTQQRQPSSPREEFVAPAMELRRLSLAAEDVLRARALTRSLELTESSRQAIAMAREILAEQGRQAQSLWNLGRLYRDRGELGLFRECLERIVLLGENSGNPFFVEAKTLLSEGSSGG